MRNFLIRKIVQNARSMIERAFIGEEIKMPRLTQNSPLPTGKLKNLVPAALENQFDMQEADAFRMKAISLLRPYGFFDTIQEKISSLQLTPLQKQTDDENQITLSQVLQPFPGERIELRGTFLRKDNRTIPVANSFELQRISHVSGFPHPAQHIGWAFSSVFIDDPIPLEAIRQALMPGESLRQRAKNWVAAKKRVFDQNKVELCGMLKVYMETLNNSPSPYIDAFFSHAVQRNDCYDYICIAHAKILENLHLDCTPDQPYMRMIQSALKRPQASYKFCAQFQLNQFIDSLKSDPCSPEEILLQFKQIINFEVNILTNA